MNTKFFKAKEFSCKCGCGLDSMDFTLRVVSELVREHFNSPTTITSGCRCLKHNRTLPKYTDISMHLPLARGEHLEEGICRAIDIRVKDVLAVEVYNYLSDLFPEALGLGVNVRHNFCHIDSRVDKAYRFTY